MSLIKALLSRDDVMIGLAIGAMFSGIWYWAWPSAYPWKDGE